MKKAALYLIGFLLFATSCDDDTVVVADCAPGIASISSNKVLPLGASRVEGARPEFESYRYELWKSLVDDGWDIDFIGSRCDGAAYPEHAGLSFDVNHEGRGGWTSGQIREGIEGWLGQTGPPDVVLFSSPGGNDALLALPFNDAATNINAIIDLLQANNPNVTILIEQLAPARSDQVSPELSTYFNQLQQEVIEIAAQQTDSASEVIVVDMFTGFTDALLADEVHYNEAGGKFIADRYYEVLVNVLE